MSTNTQDSLVDQSFEDSARGIYLHRQLKAVMAEVKTLLACAEHTDQKLLMVVGPPGVGKTTIGKMLERQIQAKEAEAMENDPAYTPVVRVLAAKPPERKSVWKTFFGRVLEAYGDILIEQKTLPTQKGNGMGQISDRMSTDARRAAVGNHIKERRTALIIIDESQHLLTKGQGRTIKDNIDVLKSLSSDTGVTLLLIGPYELPMLIERDGQLIRRSRRVHFRAYDPSETKFFFYAAKWIMAHLPLPVDKIPADFLIYSTLRYVGLLKDLLIAATQRALLAGKKSVGLVDLEASALSTSELRTIRQEQLAGEAFMAKKSGQEDELRMNLGLVPREKKKKARAKANSNPGVRNPKHDPISDAGK
jgi:DNA polymerase III delta prime subunit